MYEQAHKGSSKHPAIQKTQAHITDMSSVLAKGKVMAPESAPKSSRGSVVRSSLKEVNGAEPQMNQASIKKSTAGATFADVYHKRATLDPHKLYLDSCATYHVCFAEKHLDECTRVPRP